MRCDCVLEVLALCGFAAGPRDGGLSPFAQLYQACEADGEASLKVLLKTRLMIVSTQFKWKTFVERRMLRTAFFYLAHFLLTSGTLVYTTRLIERHGTIEMMMPDALHAALLVSNTKCLYDEARQMQLARWHPEAINYLSFESQDALWNVLDLGGITAVYAACYIHFQGINTLVLQQVGALAVLLNCFSLLQVLRPFDGTVSNNQPLVP